jgi:diaminohydroxyphosphoribosylaminopyrimidine deaminase/5-amino-6-(5-phosphoribosylamino)uracil reductase
VAHLGRAEFCYNARVARRDRTADDEDGRWMLRALALAARATGRTAPNPMVGCVLARRGRLVGEGYHHRAGGPHAEVEALRAAGSAARGSTAYVTLEPCNHTGRTGPCTEEFLAAGVARVVAAMADPNPRVDGHGAERMRAAGVPVEIGLLGDRARSLNAGWLHWLATGRPRVTLKAAVTLDGRIATASGDARWVSGEASRREAHRLRDRSDAVLVGAGTVRADDPALTTRLPGGRGRDALRVILDGKLALPLDRKVLAPGTLVATTKNAPRSREARLAARGVEVVRLRAARGAPARVDVGALLDDLGGREVLELLVEGGAEVHGAFLDAGLADRVVLFVAPRIVGDGGVPFVRLPGARGPSRMADTWRLRDVSIRRMGDDMMIVGLLDPRPGRESKP